LFEVVGGFTGQIDEVLVDDSAHSMDGPVNGRHLSEFPGFESDPDHALIDHMGGTTTLCDEYFSF
jgi:hypothetical protein